MQSNRNATYAENLNTRNENASADMEQAYYISNYVIDNLPRNADRRFYNVKDILTAYATLCPTLMVNFHRDPTVSSFSTLWIKLHDSLVDNYYITLATMPILYPPAPPSSPKTDMFEGWGTPCNIKFTIDPKLQEHIERNRHSKRRIKYDMSELKAVVEKVRKEMLE